MTTFGNFVKWICTIGAVCLFTLCEADWNSLKLSYDEPAESWTDALPVGNGSMGAMVFGGPRQERIQFNQDTLWAGKPRSYAHAGAVEHLPELRRLLFDGKQKEAEDLGMEQVMSQPLRQAAYQPFGDILIEFPGIGEVSAYNRSLDLDEAVARTVFTADGVTYRRAVFASYPDGVIAIRLKADKQGKLNLIARLDSQHRNALQVDNPDKRTLRMRGQVDDYRLERRGNVYEFEGAVRFEARLRAVCQGGSMHVSEAGIHIENADSATLYLVAGTSYENYKSIDGDPGAACVKVLSQIDSKGYRKILKAHQEDHRALFRRVQLDLKGGHSRSEPTDERLINYQQNPDPDFARLLFQYGRYLLIASSRPGGQPANLQGLWNDSKTPSWDSKYTININTEMNYWPAELTNLSECHEPLFEMLEDLRNTGAEVAKVHYAANGWVVHHNTDVWRGAAPINASNHGIWPTGGAWLATHLWERYLFTGDKEFLGDTAYPLMKGSCEFLLDYLIEDPVYGNGWLVSGPSNSPERGGLVMAPTMDHQIIRYLMKATAESAEILGKDKAFAKKLRKTADRIAPNQVGEAGQLKEWLYVEDPFTDHRHISHLWGLHPGNEINPGTPELFAASKKTLELRGDKATGWSRAWKVNFWARLRDGERMNDVLTGFFQNASIKRQAGFYNNLFDAHPPFQIDGNFGLTAGIAEALIQSHQRDENGNHILDLLPALPPAWKDGSVSGLRARGGFEVSISWEGGRASEVKVKSLLGNPIILNTPEGSKVIESSTEAGKEYSLAL